MRFPSEDEQRKLVKQWDETGRELDALLQLGENYDGPPRFGEGEVEMQRLFMLHPDHPAQKQKRADKGSTSESDGCDDYKKEF